VTMIRTHSGLIRVGPLPREAPPEPEEEPAAPAPAAWIDSQRRRRNDLWGIAYRFDWGTSLLWSGWDKSWNGPNGDLLPILFRSRKAAREWLAGSQAKGRASVVKVRFGIVP